MREETVTPPISTNVARPLAEGTVMSILLAISFSHLLNDTIQMLIPSIYPMVKESFNLSFGQIGLITLTFQLTASLLQPVVGYYTDRKPHPYSLPAGMCFTLIGLVLLSQAGNYSMVLVSVALVGIGSSVFHPEASRVAHMAAGDRHGFAQALFQVGGSGGTALGPLLAALIVVPPAGQSRVLWFSVIVIAAIFVLWNVSRWYDAHLCAYHAKSKKDGASDGPTLSKKRVGWSLAILVALMFSKFFYLACMNTYYTFYLKDRFGLSIQSTQIFLFVFLLAVAAGTIAGGHIGDLIGRKKVIWVSILGAAPFSLALPHVPLAWTCALSIIAGFILASAFPAILVYAQELLPGKVGMIAGLFFGLAFGMGGIGSAVLGHLADTHSLRFVFLICSFLPLIGLLAGFLPEVGRKK